MYGYICDRCGAHLDPGEKCDCLLEEEMKIRKRKESSLKAKELLEKSKWEQQILEVCC